MRILILAGGTGGHVFPALAVAELLQQQSHTVRWLGTPDSFEARVVPAHGIPLDTIPAQRLRGQSRWARLRAPFDLVRALWQAWRILRRYRPQVVLGMGGFAAGPGALVALGLRIPLVIHEQNAVPGLTNRYLARYATRTLAAFADCFPAKVQATVVGNPVRAVLNRLPSATTRWAARAPAQPLRLLILGGSLGAQALNQNVPQALAQLPATNRPQVRHQTGRGKYSTTQHLYQTLGVHAEVVEFIDDMAAAYAEADLVICRSGALTVSELAAIGCAAILVPYPYAVDDHQTQNAQALISAGAAVLIHQEDLTPERLVAQLQPWLDNPTLLQPLAERAQACATPQAAHQVATICTEIAA